MLFVEERQIISTTTGLPGRRRCLVARALLTSRPVLRLFDDVLTLINDQRVVTLTESGNRD